MEPLNLLENYHKIQELRKKIPPSLLDKLNLIDEWLSGEDGRELSKIMSALRGPDDPDLWDLKFKTTNYVRHLAFPMTAYHHFGVAAGWDSMIDGELAPQVFNNRFRKHGSGHFFGHIKSALEALGLGQKETKPASSATSSQADPTP